MMLDLEHQSYMFSWNDLSIFDEDSESFLNYERTPKNMDELKDIYSKSAKIEFQNLKEGYGKPLPVKELPMDQEVAFLVEMCGKKFLNSIASSFYQNNKDTLKFALSDSWKKSFVENYTVLELKAYAIDKLYEIVKLKNISEENKNASLIQINAFWNSIKDLKSLLP